MSENVLNPANVSVSDAIQPHGCLLAFDLSLEKIIAASRNLQTTFGVSPEEALALSPRDLLGKKLQQRLHDLLTAPHQKSSRFIINRQVEGSYQRFEILIYPTAQALVMEAEPMPRSGEQRLLPVVNQWFSALAEIISVKDLAKTLTQAVQLVTGFERVVLTRFESGWQREVMAETCMDSHRSVEHQPFTEDAIPAWVRDRYRINPLRYIADIDAMFVPLMKNQTAPETLDLTRGSLRTISQRHHDYLEQLAVKSSLTIALVADDKLLGMLSCHHFAAHSISPNQRDAAYNLVQMAVQRLLLLRTRDENIFLQKVMDSRELMSADQGSFRQPQKLVELYAPQWLSLFQSDGVVLCFFNQSEVNGWTPPVNDINKLKNWLSKHRHNRSVSTYNHMAKYADEIALTSYDFGLMAVHLPIETDKHGWLLFFRQHNHESPAIARRWSTIVRKSAMDLGEDLTVAIAVNQISLLNEKLQTANSQLKQIAHTDALTQIWNRYRMEQAIDNEIEAAHRYGRACTLLLFDVDHFKAVNDTHGHEVGDKVLKQLAQIVRDMLRSTDNVGRWGGEEFIVLATETEAQEALKLAERIRAGIAETVFADAGKITVSIGVAQWQKGNRRRDLLDRADQAMYAAKQAGRDQIKVN